MQRIYSEKTNERISEQKLEATNTEGLSDELRQRLVAIWNDLECIIITRHISESLRHFQPQPRSAWFSEVSKQ